MGQDLTLRAYKPGTVIFETCSHALRTPNMDCKGGGGGGGGQYPKTSFQGVSHDIP